MYIRDNSTDNIEIVSCDYLNLNSEYFFMCEFLGGVCHSIYLKKIWDKKKIRTIIKKSETKKKGQ